MLGSCRGARLLLRGGTLTDTNALPPGSREPGFGGWARNADGNSCTGDTRGEVRDRVGHVLAGNRVTDDGTRCR